MRPGQRRGRDNALGREGGVRQCDIIADRTVEQDVVLQDHADLTAQPGRVDLRDIDAVDEHPAALGHVKALRKLGQGALAGPGRADDSDHLSGRNVQTDVVENFRAVYPVTKGDVFERDIAADRGKRHPAWIVRSARARC